MKMMRGMLNTPMFMKDIKGGKSMTVDVVFSWIEVQGNYLFKVWDEEADDFIGETDVPAEVWDKTILYMYATDDTLIIEVAK